MPQAWTRWPANLRGLTKKPPTRISQTVVAASRFRPTASRMCRRQEALLKRSECSVGRDRQHGQRRRPGQSEALAPATRGSWDEKRSSASFRQKRHYLGVQGCAESPAPSVAENGTR